MTNTSQNKSWTLFSLGLLLAVIGTFALMLLLYYWEQSVARVSAESADLHSGLHQNKATETKVTSINPQVRFDPTEDSHREKEERSNTLNFLETALKANQEQHEQLAKTLESKIQELEKQTEENNQLELKALQIAQDFADYKLFSEEQLKQKQLQINTLQQMADDQRTEMEKRQEQIYQLDTKVHDLSYEIKTLLYLNEDHSIPVKAPVTYKEPDTTVSHAFVKGIQHSVPAEQATTALQEWQGLENPVKTPVEATALLRKCINMAQKLTGANYHGHDSSLYREFSSSFSAIDQRRLFDNLRSEQGALIIVYSQKENKLLFVNNESKRLLGWSPEKFVADFVSIVHEAMNEWKKALSLLATSPDSQARLLAKSKQGQEIILNCQLGLIPTGIFRNYIIGILYPV